MSGSRIFMVAGEASGDLLAREVVEAIRQKSDDVVFAGIGGRELAAVGIHSPFDISPLSILGFAEGIRAYGTVVKLADAAADAIVDFKPDAVVLVDSWGFMLRVAQRVRARAPHIRLIKLIGPQVWATRPGRAKTLVYEGEACSKSLVLITPTSTPGLSIRTTGIRRRLPVSLAVINL